MSRLLRFAAVAAPLMVLSATMLAACGHRTGLERPAPMWGDAREQYMRDQAAKADAERARQEAERAAAEQAKQAPPPSSPLEDLGTPSSEPPSTPPAPTMEDEPD